MNQFSSLNIFSFNRNPFVASLLRAVMITYVLCLSFFGAQGSPNDIWQKGNAFYQQKQYDSAAFYFEQIAAKKPADATLFYNLGNTYYRLNKVGLAVLNYERALKRNPNYKEAGDNLLLAQSRIPGSIVQAAPDIFFVRWWKAVTAPATIMVWAVLSLVFFISLIGLLLYRRLKKKEVYIRPQYVGALTLLWLLSLFLAFAAAYATLSNVRAVVVSGAADLNIKGKFAPLPEGTVVKITGIQNNQYEVLTIDGRTGKLSKNAVQVVD